MVEKLILAAGCRRCVEQTTVPYITLPEPGYGRQATDLAHFFLMPKEVISTRLLEQAAAASAERSGDNEGQVSEFGGDTGAPRFSHDVIIYGCLNR